jgi:two-component system NtrC family sensor kinase
MTKTPMVLVVEDDEWLAQQHVRTLEMAGFKADYVAHALAAIETIDTKLPDVLVIDVFLAGPNAFTLLHELQSHSDLAEIPVILCTNAADVIPEEDSRAYGVRQVLDKTTMHPKDLVAAVKKVLA